MRFCRLATISLVLTALGCASAPPRPPATASDFPQHDRDQQFQIHWRLDRAGERATVAGLLETTDSSVSGLTVHVYGVDAAGRVVSQGLTRVAWGFGAGRTQPFHLVLHPNGREARFEVRLENITSGRLGD